MPNTPRLSVIIPVLNDAEGLRRCLRSLQQHGVPSTEAETIVVDNGSRDGSGAVAAAAGASVLELPGLRVGELRNRGAAAGRGEILAFVDADQEVVPGWLDTACRLTDEPDVGATGALYLSPPDGTWVQSAYGRLRGRSEGRRDVEWLAAGNLIVKRAVFTKVGGFDTKLEACEDIDLCQRIRAEGWRIVSDERLGSVHHGDPATLAALFRSELWRGRDNIRVSVRHLTWRGLPSLVIPAVDIACLVLVLISPLAGSNGWLLGGSAGAIIAGLAGLRALRILRSAGPRGPRAGAEAFAAAAVYDLARALALVFRAAHRRARS